MFRTEFQGDPASEPRLAEGLGQFEQSDFGQPAGQQGPVQVVPAIIVIEVDVSKA